MRSAMRFLLSLFHSFYCWFYGRFTVRAAFHTPLYFYKVYDAECIIHIHKFFNFILPHTLYNRTKLNMYLYEQLVWSKLHVAITFDISTAASLISSTEGVNLLIISIPSVAELLCIIDFKTPTLKVDKSVEFCL